MSDKVYVGPKVQSFARGREYAPVSRVTMWYDDEHYYTAGDDSGREISCENPWATQEMVNNVYRQLKGFVYRPFEASGVEIDPAFELGDAVTVGGIYSFIGHATQHFDAMGGTDISLPGEQEVDHEYPYVSPQERELKRRVKLGQKYQGVSIDRRNGLTIVETDGESEGAKVVLNSKELSFYDAGGGRVLYFDPASGTYKFLGEVNVNDKFVVDKVGNVTLAGNINMTDGVITWGGNGPVKYQFAASLTGPWHETMAANDKYRRDSLDGGTTWGEGYQFVGTDGKDGADGHDGSDATVPKYITDTVIAKGVIEAPQINANDFSIYPQDSVAIGGSFNLFGNRDGEQYHFLKIKYGQGSFYEPIIYFDSPKHAQAEWGFDSGTRFTGPVTFGGDVDFGDNHPIAVFG